MYDLDTIQRMNREFNSDEPTHVEASMSAEKIADEVLADHAIQPHWVRTGEQVRELLIEAARKAGAKC